MWCGLRLADRWITVLTQEAVTSKSVLCRARNRIIVDYPMSDSSTQNTPSPQPTKAKDDESASKPSKASVFRARLFSTVLMWALVAGTFWWGHPIGYFSLVGALAVLGCWEYFRMAKGSGIVVFTSFGLSLAIAYSVGIWWMLRSGGQGPEGIGWLDGGIAFVAILGGFSLILMRKDKGDCAFQPVLYTLFGIFYPAVLFHFVTRILFFAPEGVVGPPVTSGAWLALWLVLVTKFTDMGAYIVGSLIGKNKLIPSVSPSKTWEGFFGALVISQVPGIALFLMLPNQLGALHSLPVVIGLGLVIAFLAVIGDLAESVIKRSLTIKDSGHALPGIGGVLDLIDSLCFTAPIFYLYLRFFA